MIIGAFRRVPPVDVVRAAVHTPDSEKRRCVRRARVLSVLYYNNCRVYHNIMLVYIYVSYTGTFDVLYTS